MLRLLVLLAVGAPKSNRRQGFDADLLSDSSHLPHPCKGNQASRQTIQILPRLIAIISFCRQFNARAS
jgi:hypothetical protein